jgi:hypothetical protein
MEKSNNMKKLILIIALMIPLVINAKWVKIDADLHEILTMNNRDGKIIDISTVDKAQVTTVQGQLQLFRCIHLPLANMKFRGCYVLHSNK